MSTFHSRWWASVPPHAILSWVEARPDWIGDSEKHTLGMLSSPLEAPTGSAKSDLRYPCLGGRGDPRAHLQAPGPHTKLQGDRAFGEPPLTREEGVPGFQPQSVQNPVEEALK